MKEISLYDFAMTGNFGEVKIGMPKSEIIDILGLPDSDVDFETGSSGLMYGWFEFFYWTGNERLHDIQNDHLDPDDPSNFHYLNLKFIINPWIFNKQLRLQEVLDILNSSEIHASLLDFLDRKIIKLDSGFIFDFDNEQWDESEDSWANIPDYKDYKLIGFRYSEE